MSNKPLDDTRGVGLSPVVVAGEVRALQALLVTLATNAGESVRKATLEATNTLLDKQLKELSSEGATDGEKQFATGQAFVFMQTRADLTEDSGG